jgi:hypothetical protein
MDEMFKKKTTINKASINVLFKTSRVISSK